MKKQIKNNFLNIYVITATLYCLRRQNFLDFSFFNAKIEFCIILAPGGGLGGSGGAEPLREKKEKGSMISIFQQNS